MQLIILLVWLLTVVVTSMSYSTNTTNNSTLYLPATGAPAAGANVGLTVVLVIFVLATVALAASVVFIWRK